MKAVKSLVFVGVMFAANLAFAQSPTVAPDVESECFLDSDCPDGFSCVTGGESVCPGCAGDGCPPCQSMVWSYCEPPPPEPCTADADCSTGEVCVSFEYATCSGGGSTEPACNADTGECPTCGPDDDCDAPMPAEEVCTSQTEAFCVPQYIAPCSVDADCGGGFTCEEQSSCACASPPPVDPDDPNGSTPIEPDCDCGPSGDKYCELVDVDCITDMDCSGVLTCQDLGYDTPTTVVVCADGEVCDEPAMPEPAPPTMKCAPDDFYSWGSTDESGAERLADATGINGEVQTDRVSWGSDGSGSKGDADGCSSTGTTGPAGLLPVFLALGLIGLRRRD